MFGRGDERSFCKCPADITLIHRLNIRHSTGKCMLHMSYNRSTKPLGQKRQLLNEHLRCKIINKIK